MLASETPSRVSAASTESIIGSGPANVILASVAITRNKTAQHFGGDPGQSLLTSPAADRKATTRHVNPWDVFQLVNLLKAKSDLDELCFLTSLWAIGSIENATACTSVHIDRRLSHLTRNCDNQRA